MNIRSALLVVVLAGCNQDRKEQAPDPSMLTRAELQTRIAGVADHLLQTMKLTAKAEPVGDALVIAAASGCNHELLEHVRRRLEEWSLRPLRAFTEIRCADGARVPLTGK